MRFYKNPFQVVNGIDNGYSKIEVLETSTLLDSDFIDDFASKKALANKCEYNILVIHRIPNGTEYIFHEDSVCQHPGECDIIIDISGSCQASGGGGGGTSDPGGGDIGDIGDIGGGGIGGDPGSGSEPSEPSGVIDTPTGPEELAIIESSLAFKIYALLEENLNTEQYAYLDAEPVKAFRTYNFLVDHMIDGIYPLDIAQDFAIQGINIFMNDNPLITFSPLIKYPKGSNYDTQYPKLTEYLKNQLSKVADIPLITNAIMDITGLSLGQIQNDLKWNDQGPEINIVQLDNYLGEGSSDVVGRFVKETPNKLFIDIDFVNKLENDLIIQEEEDAFLFFLGTTILHEYVHLGDYNNGDNYRYPLTEEEGRLFEVIVYGQNVHDYNALEILSKY